LPQLSGPSLFNFSEVSRLLLDANALVVASNVDDLSQQVVALCADKARRDAMGQAGLAVAMENRGALKRLLTAVDERLASV